MLCERRRSARLCVDRAQHVEGGRSATRRSSLRRTFADQAVIAIENARLFNETRDALHKVEQRTAELTESLARQTATSEVLKLISRSTSSSTWCSSTLLESCSRLSAVQKAGGAGPARCRRRVHLAPVLRSRPTGGVDERYLALLSGAAVHAGEDSAAGAILHRRRAHRRGPIRPGLRTGPDLAGVRQRTRGCSALLRQGGSRIGVINAAQERRRRAVHPRPDRARHDVRRPGGDRDRERAPVQRDQGSARAADRDRQHPAA